MASRAKMVLAGLVMHIERKSQDHRVVTCRVRSLEQFCALQSWWQRLLSCLRGVGVQLSGPGPGG